MVLSLPQHWSEICQKVLSSLGAHILENSDILRGFRDVGDGWKMDVDRLENGTYKKELRTWMTCLSWKREEGNLITVLQCLKVYKYIMVTSCFYLHQRQPEAKFSHIDQT